MSRAVLAWDRFVAILAGLILTAAGILGILWWGKWLITLPAQVDVTPATDLRQQPWWPWAVAAAGVIIALIALRWLAGHLPGRGVSELNLPGSDDTGRLHVNAGAVADGLAEALEQYPAVRTARGTIRADRGQLVANVRATIDPDTDLTKMAAVADDVSRQLAAMLHRDDLTCRMQLRVSRRDSNLPRVH